MLERLKSWFFPRESLEGIPVGGPPVRVRIEGLVLGESTTKSPMSDRRGVALEYRFYAGANVVLKTPTSAPPILGKGRCGESFMVDVDGKNVMVPIAGVKLVFAGTWSPLRAPGPVPDNLIREHPDLDTFYQDLRYDEKLLNPGSRVRLTGFVEAEERARAGAYRGGGGAPWDFLAKPEMGSFVVEELFDVPDGVGL